MSQQVEPHNDYFTTQFLLAFPVTGQHEVTVEAAVVDDNDVVWTTGPRDTVAVKSYDEAVHRQLQQQYAAQRQQQRAAAAASQAFWCRWSFLEARPRGLWWPMIRSLWCQ